MFGEAFGYLRRDEGWKTTLLYGGVILTVGILIGPILILIQGYFKRVFANISHGETDPPVFDEWGKLAIDGIKMLVIQIVYGTIAALGIFIASLTGVDLFAVVGLAWAIFVLYLIPGAMINFAYADRLAAAFDVGTIAPKALTVDYLVAVVAAYLVLIVGAFASILGLILFGFVYFYISVSACHILTNGFDPSEA